MNAEIAETQSADVVRRLNVFISWSGARSKHVAGSLSSWLPMVLQDAEPYMSDEDIQVGSRWLNSISGELQRSNFGVLCLTPENRHADWVNFEAGAIAKSIAQGRVAPLLLDLRRGDLQGPLAQFQSATVDRQGILDLVHSINKSLDRPHESSKLEQIFEALWPALAEELAAVPPAPSDTPPERSTSDMLEELLLLVRDQSRRGTAVHAVAVDVEKVDLALIAARDRVEQGALHARQARRDLTQLQDLVKRGSYTPDELVTLAEVAITRLTPSIGPYIGPSRLIDVMRS